MPPLTWRNVDAPDLSRASNILNDAVANWQTGMSGASDNLTGIRDRQRRDRTAAIVPMLAGIQNSSQVDSVLAQINSQIDPRDLTPEGQAAIMAQRGMTADIDRVGAVTDATRGGESRAQTSFDRNITREDQLAGLTPELLRMQQDAYSGAYGTQNPNLSPEFRAEIGNIQPGESGGDYNKLFANAESGAFAGIRPTEMTIKEWLEFQNPSGAYGQFVAERNGGTVSTPMGGYQIIGSTLRDAAKAMGLTGDEVMTPQMQDRIAQHIFETQGTGAWEGYNPNGQGGNYVPDIASLLPAEGNMLRPEDVSGLVDDLYGDRRTAMADRQADIAAETERTVEQQRILDEELAEKAAKDIGKLDEAAHQWAVDNRETWGMGEAGMNAVIDSINQDNSISEDMRARRIAAVTNEYTVNNPAMFDSEGSYVNVAQERSFEIAETEAQAAVDHAGITMGDNVRAAIQSGGTEALSNARETASAALAGGEYSVEGADGTVAVLSSPEQLEYVVGKVRDHFDGLNQSIPDSMIYAALADGITGYGDWNFMTDEGFFLDEQKIIDNLTGIADLGDFKTARNELLTLANAQEDITNLREAYNANNEAIAFERARKGAEGGTQRVDELLAENEDLLEGMRALTRSKQDGAAEVADELTPDEPPPSAVSTAQPINVDTVLEGAVAEYSTDRAAFQAFEIVTNAINSWDIPNTPEGRAAEAWFKSPEVTRYMMENPLALAQAERDPLGFYRTAEAETNRPAGRVPDFRLPEPMISDNPRVPTPRDRLFINGFNQQ